MRKLSSGAFFSDRGMVGAPKCVKLQATSSVARGDRDGCSRYRVSKISPKGDN